MAASGSIVATTSNDWLPTARADSTILPQTLILANCQQDSILLSEQELGESGSASSTVIGKIGDSIDPESDLQLGGPPSASTIDLGGDLKPQRRKYLETAGSERRAAGVAIRHFESRLGPERQVR